MAGGRGVPLDVDPAVLAAGHLAGGATAGEVRLGLLQPVGAAGEHARAEGRVELVSGEGHPVHVELLHGDGVVRGQLGGVQDDAGAVGVRGGGQFLDGPQLAGDVGGAGDADQGGAVRLTGGERPLQGLDGLGRGARRVEVRDLRVDPGQERGVVLGLEDEDLAVGRQHRSEQVQGVRGGPGEDHLVGGAAVEELGDRDAALLEQVGGELREVSGAAVDAAVVRGVRGHVVPDALQGRGAGRVVEGGVGDLAAGDERDGDVAAEDRQRLGTGGALGGDGGGGGGVRGCGHGGISRQAGLNGFCVPVRGYDAAAVRGTGSASEVPGTRKRPCSEG